MGWNKDGFINTKLLINSLQPKDINDQYIVDPDFLEKNYCEYYQGKTTPQISQIDNHKKKIIFKDGSELKYTKCLIAWGSKKERNFENYENVVAINSIVYINKRLNYKLY